MYKHQTLIISLNLFFISDWLWLVNNNVVPGSTKMLTQEHVALGIFRFCATSEAETSVIVVEWTSENRENNQINLIQHKSQYQMISALQLWCHFSDTHFFICFGEFISSHFVYCHDHTEWIFPVQERGSYHVFSGVSCLLVHKIAEFGILRNKCIE